MWKKYKIHILTVLHFLFMLKNIHFFSRRFNKTASKLDCDRFLNNRAWPLIHFPQVSVCLKTSIRGRTEPVCISSQKVEPFQQIFLHIIFVFHAVLARINTYSCWMSWSLQMRFIICFLMLVWRRFRIWKTEDCR